jgi:putative RNA 2'-phosphotransferase
LLEGLRRESEFASVSKADIERMIANSSKVRHQLEGERIRAIYGHSIPGKVARQLGSPPDELFHGTIEKYVGAIRQEGLRPMSRQYVHLSCVPEVARAVAKRKGDAVVILKILAAAACKNGINFYQGDERVWLADSIPAEWIEFPEKF